MLRSLTLTTALVMASPMALAHGNGDTGFWSGLVHIVTSVDHLMSMVALGIWSATAGRKYQTGLVCTTPLLLLIGLMTGMLTGWVASADLAIALAILMIVVLIASGVHFQQKQWVPALSAFAFAAIFVLINGIAHSELLGSRLFAPAAAGMIGGSMVALYAGQRLGALLKVTSRASESNGQHPWVNAITGSIFAVSGLALTLG